VKHALERLVHLIDVDINPLKNKQSIPTQLQIDIWHKQAQTEKEYIIRHLRRKSLKMTDEKALELFVQQYQSEIILLLDKLFIIKKQFPGSNHTLLFNAILSSLDELLNHIELRYIRFFNQDQKLPDSSLIVIQQEISKELKTITKFLPKSMDLQLAGIILKPIKAFVKTKNGSISYRQMIYIKNLVKEISLLPLQESISIDSIIESLIYVNFNSASFIKYAIDKIINDLNSAPSSEKRVLLSIQLKKTNQLFLKPGVALHQNKLSTKERIQSWLLEELNYMEAHQTLFIRPSPSHVAEPEESSLHTSLSVQQLALWIRTAKDVGMITNQNQSALLKTVARIFKTPHSESISHESLRSKYYIPENGAKQAVKNMLMDMFKKVQTYTLFPFLIQTLVLCSLLNKLF
jgi:hypothetical protein